MKRTQANGVFLPGALLSPCKSRDLWSLERTASIRRPQVAALFEEKRDFAVLWRMGQAHR